ncbi:MAG: hypothetical protein IJ747_04895 [Lachnospiraceae bacterium]|nr:hypothetical protein [Lachnospiraceae bacterium]
MEEYAKKQYRMSVISTACLCGIFLVVLVSALIVVPQLVHTFGKVNAVMDQLSEVTKELKTMTESLGPSLESFQSAAKGLEKLDFTNLNEAVAQLEEVLGSLSWLVGR